MKLNTGVNNLDALLYNVVEYVLNKHVGAEDSDNPTYEELDAAYGFLGYNMELDHVLLQLGIEGTSDLQEFYELSRKGSLKTVSELELRESIFSKIKRDIKLRNLSHITSIRLRLLEDIEGERDSYILDSPELSDSDADQITLIIDSYSDDLYELMTYYEEDLKDVGFKDFLIYL